MSSLTSIVRFLTHLMIGEFHMKDKKTYEKDKLRGTETVNELMEAFESIFTSTKIINYK